MNTKISEAAVEAALDVYYSGNPGHGPRALKNVVRRALTAALPHLHPQPAELAEQQGVGNLPRPLEDLRDATQHTIDCADGGDDYACGRPMIEAMTALGIMEKTGRGLWSTNVQVARAVVDALAATGKQQIDPSWSLHDRVEFALRDAGFDFDEASRIALQVDGKQQVGEVRDSASRLIDAIEGECDGLVISPETAAAILDHVCLGDPWREAVFSEWALTFIDPQSEVPAEILRAVINWNVRTALDPSVSSDAAALVASGKRVGEVQGDNRSPNEMADALERIPCRALSDYEGVEADELHILRCAKLIRDLAARQPGTQVVRPVNADEAPFGLKTAEKVAWARGANDAIKEYAARPAQGIDLIYIRQLASSWRTVKMREGMGWREAVSHCADNLDVALALIDNPFDAAPAQGIDLAKARDEGHDGAIRYVLGYLNGVGDWGSTQYVELLNACGRERIIQSAVQDGELEFTGLGRWVAERGTDKDRALIDQHDAAPGVGS